MRPVALIAAFLPSLCHAVPTGGTKTLSPVQLKGFRLWDSGPVSLETSKTPGNVRRGFTVRFKNESREEISEIDVRLRVGQMGRAGAVYRSPTVALRSFDNLGIPQVGSLLPYNKSGGNTVVFDYPGRFWNMASFDDIEVVAVKIFTGAQDLHDLGHLCKWMMDTPDAGIIARFAKEPGLLRVRNDQGLDAALLSFAVSGLSVQKYVLAHGGDLRASTKAGSTAAHLAAFNTNPGIFDFLRSKGVPTDKPNASGRTPLCKAIVIGNPLSWAWLLAHGANPNQIDKDGRNTVYYALVEGQTQAFEALVRAGADKRYHNRNGWGWMHTAAVHNYLILPWVLRAGVSVNDADPRFGLTPLMAVAGSGAYDSVPWLIAHGARLDAKDAKGETAHDYARHANTLGTDRFFRDAVANAMHHSRS